MKKTLYWALLLAALLALLCASAQAEDGQGYYFMVSVTDLSSDSTSYDSCENSFGQIRLYTKRQDGSIGPTWSADVPPGEWDHRNQTLWYTLNCDEGSSTMPASLGPEHAFDAFPVRLVLWGGPSPDFENTYQCIYNKNSTYTSKERFTLWVSSDGRSFKQVQSWTETVMGGGLDTFSSDKLVDDDKMPKVTGFARLEMTPEGEIPIPRQGGQDEIVHFDAIRTDQYGVEWYRSNASTWYRLAESHDGISIDNNGKLTVTDGAAVLSSNPRYEATIHIYTRHVDYMLNRTPTMTRTISFVNPSYVLTYYSDGQPIAIYQQYYGTTWTHPGDIPVKTNDSNYHYTLTGWGTPSSVTVTQDMSFTASYAAEAHNMVLNDACTNWYCTVCGRTRDAIPGDFLAGAGTGTDPYLIQSAADWEHLSNYIAAYTNMAPACYRLESDIAVSTMLGSLRNGERPFTGVFDGNGHTVSFDVNTSEDYAAPFACVRNATIKNLKVAGQIRGTQRAAGLVGKAAGTTAVENCSIGTGASVNSNSNGEKATAGILCYADGSVNITGCVIAGSFGDDQLNTATLWSRKSDTAQIHVRDCLDAITSSHPTAMGEIPAGSEVTNTYWNDPGKTLSDWGKLGHSIGAAGNVTVDFGPPVVIYSVSGITAYQTGIAYDGTFYAGEGDEVRLTFNTTQPSLVAGIRFRVTAGNLAIGDDSYVLTMNDDDAVIYAVPDLEGSGTKDDPWQISTAEDWGTLALVVQSDIDTGGKHFILTNNISVSTMVGTSAHPFASTFNGDGKTLTVNLTASSAGKGPFAYVSGASFVHLRVVGTITTSVHDTGGLVGQAAGGCTITDCVSDVHIVANGGNGHAGFVGSLSGNVAITGSAFTGSIVGARTSYCAGFAGAGGGTVDDSVYDGTISGSSNNNTFLRQKDRAENCYYTNLDGIQRVKGNQAIAVTAVEGVAINFGKPNATYPTSGITAYNTGLMYNGVFYAGPGQSVTLELTASPFDSFDASAGALAQSGASWTLTLPDANELIRVMIFPAFGAPDFTLPAFLTTVEAEAFEGIAAGVVDVPASCTSIGAHAFRNCPNLMQIRIPANCVLGTDVFDGCEMVYVYGTAGSSAEAYYSTHANCEFVPLE